MEYLKQMCACALGTFLGIMVYMCLFTTNLASPSGAGVPAVSHTLMYEVQDQYMYREIKPRLPKEPPKHIGNKNTGVMRI